VDGQEFEKPREFKCLGSPSTEVNNITCKIKQRIVAANRATPGLRKHPIFRNVRTRPKCDGRNMIVRSLKLASQRKDEMCSRIFFL
jgi:hypothetical protein